jgi:glutamate carboxypeptidase
MSELAAYFQGQTEAMVELLTTMVSYESPSGDKALVDAYGAFIEAQLRELGAAVTRYPQAEVGDCLLARWNADAPGKPLLFLVHIDTVWAEGTLATMPIRIEDGKLYGPGAVDMKGGIAVMLSALRVLIARGELPDRPIWALVNSDEEIGSKASTPLIEEAARQAALVLVMEPGTRDGALKIARKGIATFRVHVEGRAAHAGNAPEQGINAIVELAQQIAKINGLNDLRNGTSVSVTMVDGGSAGNVIPARASAYIDSRMLTTRAMRDLREALGALQPFVPGASVRVEEIHARGPMEYNDTIQAAFERAKAIGAAHGLTVRGESVGGGSDGNTTAALGVPTLDGLGAVGDGLHATHEHVLISSLPQRATLVAGVLKDWPRE